MTSDESSIDVNKPVENPALMAAILAYAQKQTEETQDGLTRALKAARYLVPFVSDQLTTTAGKAAGDVTFQQGSQLKFPQLKLSDDKSYVPVFTDWGEIRKWTDAKIDTIILSVGDLHALFATAEDIAGVVLNVGSEPLVLKKAHLSALGRDYCGA